VLYSSGYSKVVSLNNTGLLYNRDMGTEFNRDNLLLFVNEPRTMGGYEIEFLGERLEPRHKSGYVKRRDVEPTGDPFKVVAKRNIVHEGEVLYQEKDTFEIYPENTFYEIALRQEGKTVATLYPRVQMNPGMGGILPSPDIRRNVDRDLYTHVSAPMNREAEPEWSELQELYVHPNEKFFVNDYVAYLDKVERVMELPGLRLGDEDVAVRITVRVEAEHDTYTLQPIFLIRNRTEVGRIPDETGELGVKLTLLNIHPDKNEFVLGLQTRQKDWVIIKALEKPLINILWLGTGLLTLGFLVAMVRRFRDESRAASSPQ
jgi:cytochrome c-type biogenesis protein CcmF